MRVFSRGGDGFMLFFFVLFHLLSFVVGGAAWGQGGAVWDVKRVYSAPFDRAGGRRV